MGDFRSTSHLQRQQQGEMGCAPGSEKKNQPNADKPDPEDGTAELSQAEQQDGNHDARVQKMSEQMKDARKSLEEEEHKEEHHEEYEEDDSIGPILLPIQRSLRVGTDCAATVRAACSLKSPIVGELAPNTLVVVAEKGFSDGRDRVRIAAPVAGWISAKCTAEGFCVGAI